MSSVQYRVVGQSGATVRKDINLDSPLVANLEKDSIVDISTIKGRRARIVSPVEGWSSIKTETGYVILKKEGGEMYKYRIVLKEGAVIRKGADIDASEVCILFCCSDSLVIMVMAVNDCDCLSVFFD